MFDYRIATLGSHTALQILKGARDEGFQNICVCRKDRVKPYKNFGVADEIITIDSYKDFPKVENELIKKKAIIIPHASFIEYVGIKYIEKLKVGYFGNKEILKWESDRRMEERWLRNSNLRTPLIFKDPAEIDRPCIIKFYGAKGGKGYFIANSELDFRSKMAVHPVDKYVIQEYIVGVPMYIHYFYSSLTGELEIMSFDKRYESNVDSIGRISARDQSSFTNVDPSYVVVGNVPLVLRESLLTEVIEMGERVVRESKKITKSSLFGPFCLETVLTPDQEFYVFEISARIVAGTNPFINGSPYTHLKYNKPMSTGRRIALEIRRAIEQKRLNEVLG
ncbi:MAG: formate--phosphoribosylaminoimidazolecarboxamide ligase [Nanoarchaeota archaeon]|nr:formate--phosphoribosylaminoimidazolecarboxamide ligase [Nanoarchaeota archaeon]